GGWPLWPFDAGLLVAAGLLIGAMKAKSPAARSLCFPLFLTIHLSLCIWIIRSSPQPRIDVWMFQQRGAADLLQGHNPYEMTFPDIYHSEGKGQRKIYGTGMVVNDQLQFGFPYFPVT